MDLKHVQELLSGEVSGEGLQRLLAMHEDDGVALLQEVLRRRSPARARTEVVHETDRVVL